LGQLVAGRDGRQVQFARSELGVGKLELEFDKIELRFD